MKSISADSQNPNFKRGEIPKFQFQMGLNPKILYSERQCWFCELPFENPNFG